jgi:cytochrome d ubiquinol oxidase subunit I
MDSPRLLKLMFWAIALPYIANAAGWIFTEIARQPWIVFGLQRTAEGLSPTSTVGAGHVLFSLVAFTLIYAVLMVVAIGLIKKYASAGIVDSSAESSVPLEAW